MTPIPILTQLLILSVLAVMVFHSYRLWRKGQWRLMDPLNLFWAGCAVCYVEQPTNLYSLIITWQTEGHINLTLFWCAFAMMWVAIGYSLRFGVTIGNRIPHLPARLKFGRMMLFSVYMILVGLVGYGIQIWSIGGWSNWISVGRGQTNWVILSGYVTFLVDFVPAGTLLLLLTMEMFKVKGFMRLVAWAACSLVLLWLLYLGTRSRTVLFSMSMLAVWLLPRSPEQRKITWTRGLGLLLLFLMLNVVTKFQAYYRGHFTNLSFNLDEVDMEEARTRVLPHVLTGASRDFAEDAKMGKGLEFNCVASVIKLVPEDTPYNFGFPILQLGTNWIPHALWPDKRYPLLEAQYPVMSMGQLSQMRVEGDGIHPMLAGPAFTYVGYWYHVLGPIGLIIGGIYTGTLLRTIRQILDRDPGNQGNLLLFLSLFAIPFTEAAATPFAWAGNLPLVVIPIMVLIYVSRDTSVPRREHQLARLPELA